MKIFLDIILFIVTLAALMKSVDVFIKSSGKIAHHFRLSGYTINFFLVAVATSMPEMLVAFSSGMRQESVLSFGVAMGSNIALLTLIISLPIMFNSKIPTRSVLLSKDAYYMLLFSLLPMAMGADGALSRLDGIILLIAYVIYMATMVKPAKGLEKILDEIGPFDIKKQILLFVVSLIVLLSSSQILVRSAVELSIHTNLPLGFIGLSMTALGTSLPEIVYTIASARKGKNDEILGDVLGSVVANSTLVLGIAAITFPIDISTSKIGMSTFFFYVLVLLVFLRFARTKESLSKAEAAILLMLYVMFIATEYYIQGH